MLRSAAAGFAEHANAPRSVQRQSVIQWGVKTIFAWLLQRSGERDTVHVPDSLARLAYTAHPRNRIR